jgi:cytochrome c oxidase subunit 2
LVAIKDTTNADLTIKATGYQWKWGYDYLKGEGEGIGFHLHPGQRTARNVQHRRQSRRTSTTTCLKVDNPLVVPVDKKIRIITTANDVIHAFAVPSLGIKQDAIPGFVRDTWFRAEKMGDFHGQCQELCGKEHAYMPIHVKVLSAQKTTPAGWRRAEENGSQSATIPAKCGPWTSSLKRGEKVYAANCAACHQANGKGAGPIKPLDGAAVVLDADKTKQITVLLEWPKQRRHALVEAAQSTPTLPR